MDRWWCLEQLQSAERTLHDSTASDRLRGDDNGTVGFAGDPYCSFDCRKRCYANTMANGGRADFQSLDWFGY